MEQLNDNTSDRNSAEYRQWLEQLKKEREDKLNKIG